MKKLTAQLTPQLTAQQVISAARQYVGLKYRTQGRDVVGESAGLDCGGLLVVVCKELSITDSDLSGYSNSPDGATFEKLLQTDLDEVTPKEDVRLADILAMNYGEGVQHIAIVSAINKEANRYTVIHAKRPRGSFGSTDKGVIEQYLHGYDLRAWSKTFRIKGIEN